MNSRIENCSGGKYLYIEAETAENGFESRMAASVTGECLIAPQQVFAYGGMCLEYCISGLVSLEEYLSGVRLKSMDMVQLLAQIEQSVNTVKNYLLSEAELLINPDYVYIDAEQASIRLCVVPGYNGSFESELKLLVNRLLIHMDNDDADTLRLGFRLLKAVSAGDCRLHDIIDAVRIQGAAQTTSCRAKHGVKLIMPNEQTYEASAPDLDPADESDFGKTEYEDSQYGSQYDRQYAKTAEYEQVPSAETGSGDEVASFRRGAAGKNETDMKKPRSELRDTLTGLFISQGILIAAAAVIYLIKGRALMLRLLPIYLVIAICMTVYYAVSLIMKKRQKTAGC